MTGIRVEVNGDFSGLDRFITNIKEQRYLKVLDRIGRRGVDALSNATPVDSGVTAASWGYEVHRSKRRSEIIFTNSNVNDGVNIAIILQYGHGTGTGGYVAGRDYINPALAKTFDQLADEAWRAVTNG